MEHITTALFYVFIFGLLLKFEAVVGRRLYNAGSFYDDYESHKVIKKREKPISFI